MVFIIIFFALLVLFSSQQESQGWKGALEVTCLNPLLKFSQL